jgi:hypothetical protein
LARPDAERADPRPLTDAELDDALVRLVGLYPGRLGQAEDRSHPRRPSGRKIKAKYCHLPDYGRDPVVSLEQVRTE